MQSKPTKKPTLELHKLHQYIFGDWAMLDFATVPEKSRYIFFKSHENDIKVFFAPFDQDSRFRAALRVVKNTNLEKILFQNTADELKTDYSFPDDKTIEQHFNRLEKEYHYYLRDKKSALEAFKQAFKICKLIGDLIEKNNDASDALAALHAYKLLVAFKNLSEFDEYLSLFNNKLAMTPVHDALEFTLPINIESINLEKDQKSVTESKEPQTKFKINKEDLVYIKGIDTFLRVGQKIGTLALQRNKRDEFFKRFNLIKPLLTLQRFNPLLEEGIYNPPYSREKEGELFLPSNAFKLLIYYKIQQHVKKADGLPYNTNNLFIIDNNEENLLTILRNLNLKDGEDAKFVYIHNIHVIPFYIRREKDAIKCFIIDPEQGINFHITSALHEVFEHPKIIASDTKLQLDYFSCSTFGLKALMYFVKHGPEIFSYLEKKTLDQYFDMFVLSQEDLMPPLLKMCQTMSLLYPLLSEEAKDTVVSHKQKLTLRDYLVQAELKVHDKSFNIKAIQLKYETFAFLNNCLQKDLSQGEAKQLISGVIPDKLQKIIDSFEEIPRVTASSSFLKF